MIDSDSLACRKLSLHLMSDKEAVIGSLDFRRGEHLERNLLVHEAFVTFGNPLQSIYHGLLSFVLQTRLYGFPRAFKSLVEVYGLR